MNTTRRRAVAVSQVLLPLLLVTGGLEAQGRSNQAARGGSQSGVSADVTFSVTERSDIATYYAAHLRTSTVAALPPGIRKNLERGKSLPPGIAKKVPPAALTSRLTIPRGYEVYEVGLDVLLVEVATGVIHDVLMDVVR